MGIESFIETVNIWAQDKIPFIFLVDFEMEKPVVWKLDEIDPAHVLFDVNGRTNATSLAESNSVTPENSRIKPGVTLRKFPSPFGDYKEKFDAIHSRLGYGDSYLVNLTMKTRIEVNSSLRSLFFMSRAKYKLWWKDHFLVFSPEPFVRISSGEICSYPMKGTMDASIPDAEKKLLDNKKELAEHVTIVDLIRNDLGRVADSVFVRKFRYVEKLKTSDKSLLQASSEIVGLLPTDYRTRLGEILCSLLPAGSISGAPKCRTLEIIRNAEKERRGYYTGVFGLYDGENLDSSVLIRFIEEGDGSLYYRSGGGITYQSDPVKEYEEVIDKIYVPVD